VKISVVDAHGAARDPGLPALRVALDPAVGSRRIAPLLGPVGVGGAIPRLQAIQVVRHKPGRRCLVEYRFAGPFRIFGKMRARGADLHTHRLLETLWETGFRPDGDRLADVPEPLGIAHDLRMTFQRGVPGQVATDLVGEPEGIELMKRVAGAIHALHCAGVAPRRRHALGDELRILEERLELVERLHPRWGERIERLRQACRLLAGRLDEPRPCGIHRDFYPDQLIDDGGRITLLDLDLYALGDPALDVGNFAGHLIEQGLRCHGDPAALQDHVEALEEATLRLAPDVSHSRLRAYTNLTLARHIQISTTIPGRENTTSALLDLCEQRLGIKSSGAVAATSGRRACPPGDRRPHRNGRGPQRA